MKPIQPLILVGLLGLVPACSVSRAEPKKEKAPAPRAAPVAPAVVVKVAPARTSRFTEEVFVQGRTVADADLTYSAEVPGTVESLRLEPGSRVRRGQVLARIDYRSLRARADAARARLTLQQKTCRRLTTLRQGDLVPQDQLDRAEAARVAADAEHKIALANLGKSVIRARRGGVVVRRFVRSGEYVAPGAPVLRVVDLDRVVVEGQVPESLVSSVNRGAAASVRIRALGRTVKGKVHAVLPVAADGSRTFKVRIKLKNPGHAILVGMAASVKIAVRTHAAVVLVPQDVVQEEGGARAVFVVGRDNRAVRRLVTLGPTAADRVVIRAGVQPGERLVVLGQRELKAGQRVRVFSEKNDKVVN